MFSHILNIIIQRQDDFIYFDFLTFRNRKSLLSRPDLLSRAGLRIGGRGAGNRAHQLPRDERPVHPLLPLAGGPLEADLRAAGDCPGCRGWRSRGGVLLRQ